MSRIKKLQDNLPQGPYAALIYSEHNRRYFNGFDSSDGILFVTHDKAYFLIDSRYVEAARAESHDCEVMLLENTAKQLSALASDCGIKTVGIEAYELPVATAAEFERFLPGVTIDKSNTLNDIVERLRMVKSPEEIAKMKKSQEITDAAFQNVLKIIKPGVTEHDIALEIEYYMKKHGASGPSFDLIAIAGENTSKPHGVPGNRTLHDGDFITMDIGSVFEGYCSDMTRTVALGHVNEEQRKVYSTVLKAQLETEKYIHAGVKCFDVDRVARDIIYSAGYKGCFGHGLGHSVGLQIHEKPFCSPHGIGTLEENMTMTVEPGIYLAGKFGVRIEDCTLVTKDGCKPFTNLSKELIVL